jgi:hypothetical protein
MRLKYTEGCSRGQRSLTVYARCRLRPAERRSIEDINKVEVQCGSLASLHLCAV